jgi:hypothetical protein
MASGYGISASSKDLLIVGVVALGALYLVKTELDKVTDPASNIFNDAAYVVHEGIHPWDTFDAWASSLYGSNNGAWFS